MSLIFYFVASDLIRFYLINASAYVWQINLARIMNSSANQVTTSTSTSSVLTTNKPNDDHENLNLQLKHLTEARENTLIYRVLSRRRSLVEVFWFRLSTNLLRQELILPPYFLSSVQNLQALFLEPFIIPSSLTKSILVWPTFWPTLAEFIFNKFLQRT